MKKAWYEVRSAHGRVIHTFEGQGALKRANTFAGQLPGRAVFLVSRNEKRVEPRKKAA